MQSTERVEYTNGGAVVNAFDEIHAEYGSENMLKMILGHRGFSTQWDFCESLQLVEEYNETDVGEE